MKVYFENQSKMIEISVPISVKRENFQLHTNIHVHIHTSLVILYLVPCNFCKTRSTRKQNASSKSRAPSQRSEKCWNGCIQAGVSWLTTECKLNVKHCTISNALIKCVIVKAILPVKPPSLFSVCFLVSFLIILMFCWSQQVRIVLIKLLSSVFIVKTKAIWNVLGQTNIVALKNVCTNSIS